jgi:hypothetical protein
MDTLTPFLLEAKREYLTRLSDDLSPIILRDMRALYEEAKKEQPSKALYSFQSRLKQIPKWNASLVREKTASVETKSPYLSSLIAAVFVSFIKVMSSVRVSQDEKPNIRLKLPTNDAFVHQVYVETARKLYENPELVRQVSSSDRIALVQVAIETTVRDQLPLQDILQAYLGKSVDDEGTMAPVLSPVHSDEDEPTPVADDSDFQRTGQVDEAFSESSSESEEEEEAQPKFIPMPDSTPSQQPHPQQPHPQQPQPMPQPMPQPQPMHPYPQQHRVQLPASYQQQHPPQPPHVPQPPKALFDDADDGHF